MNLDSLSFFNLASKRLTWLAGRQQVISQNIANADTPGFRAQDVTPFAEMVEESRRTEGFAVTQARHIRNDDSLGAALTEADDVAWEQSIDGNTVVLEQQVIKATDTEDSYRLAADLYRKAHELLRLATTGNR